MKKWVHRVEILVDRAIPYLLGVLLLIIVGEIFFHEFMVKNHTGVQIIDWFIIVVFATDLYFKYNRMRNLPRFLRSSWLEILAIFPFFLIFRFFEGIIDVLGVGETAVSQTQKFVHVGSGVEREVAVEARSSRFARFLRPLARSVRFFELENPRVRRETKRNVEEFEREVELGSEYIIKGVRIAPTRIKAALFYEKGGVSYYNKGKIDKRRAT